MRSGKALLGLESTVLIKLHPFDFAHVHHPFVCDFARIVSNPLKGVPEQMPRDVKLNGMGADGFDFYRIYQPIFWSGIPSSRNSLYDHGLACGRSSAPPWS